LITWNPNDRYVCTPEVVVLSNNNLTVDGSSDLFVPGTAWYNGNQLVHYNVGLRATQGFNSGKLYYELYKKNDSQFLPYVSNNKGLYYVAGFAKKEASLVLPGRIDSTWGNWATMYNFPGKEGNKIPYEEEYTLMFALDLSDSKNRKFYWGVNGQWVNIYHGDTRITVPDGELYPYIVFGYPIKFETNFGDSGKPFKYKNPFVNEFNTYII